MRASGRRRAPLELDMLEKLAMSDVPGILLIDDGELDAVAAMLDRLHVSYTRMRGSLAEDELAPPEVLLIATPRRAGIVRRDTAPRTRRRQSRSSTSARPP